MDKMKMGVIVAVVAIAAIAIAAFVLMNNSGGGHNEDTTDYPVRGDTAVPALADIKTPLWVLGNANHDDRVDSKDVTAINNLIKQMKYDYFGDANNDGVIDNKDVKQVENMIGGSATDVYYINVDDEIKVYHPTKKVNIVCNHRCIVRSMMILSNQDRSTYKIVGVNNLSEGDGPGKEFDYYRWSTMPINITSANKEMDIEAIDGLEKQYGSLVITAGSALSYGTNLDKYYEDDKNVQIVRFCTWEGYTLEGILTTGYLLAGVGDSTPGTGTTAWDSAVKYETWYNGYYDQIVKEVAKSTKKSTIILAYYTASSKSLTLRGPLSGDYINSEICGGDNLAKLYTDGERTTNLTPEDIAARAGNVDVVVYMTGDSFSDPNYARDQALSLAEYLSGYVSTDADFYSSSWYLNGAPVLVQLAHLAKMLNPDSSVLQNFDMKKIWDEYRSFMGWSDRTDDVFEVVTILEEPVHTTA